MNTERSSARLVDFVQDPEPFIERMRVKTEPLFLTESGSEPLVLLSPEMYERLRPARHGQSDSRPT